MENLIGTRISELRKSKGLTQEKLAEMANVNLRTIQRIESGETTPRGHTLSAICKALNINTEEILNYGKTEDNSFIAYMHMSVIAGTFIPLIGDMLLPGILWSWKKNTIAGVETQGKNLLLSRMILNISFLLITIILVITFHGNIGLGRFELMIMIYFLLTFLYPIYIAIYIFSKKRIRSFYPNFVK